MKGDVHVDHIIPCKIWDLTREGQQRRCFHYTNLAFMWGDDNVAKNDKILYHGKLISASSLNKFQRQEIIDAIPIPPDLELKTHYLEHSTALMLPIAGTIKPFILV
ncbi:MAG: hypothetical protein M0P71_16935 [Melioribacteraceae bacterium]|nr:hypothetical protein [Melioribacteraceae bacterium]